MRYCFDAEKISLIDLKNRIETSDLVPSRESLKLGLEDAIKSLMDSGITSMADFRRELKDNKHLTEVADRTVIDTEYLVLLRREVESYCPRPFPLKEFNWLTEYEIEKLSGCGINNSLDLFEKWNVAEHGGLSEDLVNDLFRVADLTRIQWINPTAARMLVDAGFDTHEKVESADPQALYEAMNKVNVDYKYFKGKIGLRDIGRLIHAAKYICLWY
jgi:hypothetical protein